MDRKKILWVSHFLPFPPKGGAQIRSFNLIKELANYHDVHLFCLVQEDLVLNYFDSLELALSEAEKTFDEICISVKLIPLKRNFSKSKNLKILTSIFSIKSYAEISLNAELVRPELELFIKDIDFEFVHFDTASLIIFKSLFPSKKITINHHNVESLMMVRRAKEQSNWLVKIICLVEAIKVKSLERKSVDSAFVHLVCSDLDGGRLKMIFPNIVVITIPNGIDCTTVIGSRSSDDRSLLFIGGLDWYPNADAVQFILKEVFPIVFSKIPTIKVDIIGKNPSAEIINLAKKSSNIKLHGFVNDISPFYERSWLYVCPIRDGGGTKLKVLDAMANGIPLVAHPVAMEGIDAVPGKHYFSASTAQEFADIIISLSTSSADTSNQVGKNAKDLIFSKYDYSEIGRSLARLYFS